MSYMSVVAAGGVSLCLLSGALGQTGFWPVTELGFPEPGSYEVANAANVYLGEATRFVVQLHDGPGAMSDRIGVTQNLVQFTPLPSVAGTFGTRVSAVTPDGVHVLAKLFVGGGAVRALYYEGVSPPVTSACSGTYMLQGPVGISDDGRALLIDGVLDGQRRSYLVTDGVCEPVCPEISGQGVVGNCISPDGQTVAGYLMGTSQEFVWTRGGATRILPVPAAGAIVPYFVSDGGSRVANTNPPAGPDLRVWTYGEGGWRYLSWLPSYQLPVIKQVRDNGGAMVGSSDLGALYWSPTTGGVALSDEFIGRGVNLRGWTLISAERESADGRTFVGLGRPPGSSQVHWWRARVEPFAAADIGRGGGTSGGDGRLDNNDLVVFIDRFFAHDERADVGGVGGVRGGDGAFDNNDFVVYVDLFFGGQP